jgi:precorrin-2 dehydrogenase / sirohydrochlorin ferrochelatase
MLRLPIFLDLRHCDCLVVGGGAVGRRKARAICSSGGRATVLDLGPRPSELPNDIVWRQGPYQSEILGGFRLVFAAASTDVNKQVVLDCRNSRIWVNSATDPDSGDFILPAVRRVGRVECAVATGGSSPILSRRIADRLIEIVDEPYVIWIDLLAEIRKHVNERVAPERRSALYQTLCEPSWPERIAIDGVESAANTMAELVAAAASS